MKPFRERNPFVVGGVSVAVLAALFAFAFSINRFPFITRVYLVRADFADAAGLTPENEVRVAGLKVGKVRSIELRGDRVRVTMEIRRGVRLGRATTAEIKLKTLLGSKFVALTPRGGEPYLGSGDVIPLERTLIPFELYQATNQSVDLLRRLDAAALNDALRELAALTEDPTGNFGRALDGLARATQALAQRQAELDSLLRNADPLLASLAARSAQLADILDAGSRLLGALAARREALQAFVRGTDRVSAELAGLLSRTRPALDSALADLHSLLADVVAPRGDDLRRSLRVLGADAESFARVFRQGRWVDVFTEGLVIPPPVAP